MRNIYSRLTGLIILTFAILFLLNACKNYFGDGDKIKEGIIEYEINYLENKMTGFSSSLLPKTMYMKFNDDMAMNSIEGMMGAFFMRNIVDFDELKNITMLKALNNEFFYVGEKKEMPVGYHHFDDMEIEITKDTLVLAGLPCKKAIARLGNGNEYPVYFTEEIGIKKPNELNPYNEIDGVLMQFQIELSNIKMELTATKLHQCAVLDKEFEIPKGFRRISKEKMEELINDLME